MGHNPEWSSDPAVRTLVYAMLATLYEGHAIPDRATPAALRSLWHGHGSELRDGTVGFFNLIAQKLLSTGGTIEERRVVSHLVFRSTVKTVVTTDGGRFTAEAVVLDGGDASLSALWEGFEAPQPSVCEMEVLLPPGHCPEALRDPCGWAIDMDSAACSVRVDEDTLGLRWPAHQSPPNLEYLIPFHVDVNMGPVVFETLQI